MASVAPRLRARHTETGSFENTYSNPAGIAGGLFEGICCVVSLGFRYPGGRNSERDPVVPERSGGLSFGTTFTSPSRVGVRTGWLSVSGCFTGLLSDPRTDSTSGDSVAPIVGNRSETLGVHAGASVRVLDTLSIGFGVKVLAELVGEIRVAPEQPEPCRAVSGTSSDTASPLGASTGGYPRDGLLPSCSGERNGSLLSTIVADLGDSCPSKSRRFRLRELPNDPRQVAGAVAFSVTEALIAEVALQWRQWSAYPRPMEPATTATEPPATPGFLRHVVSTNRSALRGGPELDNPENVPGRIQFRTLTGTGRQFRKCDAGLLTACFVRRN